MPSKKIIIQISEELDARIRAGGIGSLSFECSEAMKFLERVIGCGYAGAGVVPVEYHAWRKDRGNFHQKKSYENKMYERRNDGMEEAVTNAFNRATVIDVQFGVTPGREPIDARVRTVSQFKENEQSPPLMSYQCDIGPLYRPSYGIHNFWISLLPR